MNDFAAAADALKRGQTALSPFEAAAQKLKAQQAGSVGLALTYDGRDPDRAAKSLAIGRELGISPLVVDGEPEAYDLQLRLKKSAEALKSAPKTAAWLADMGNGVLAKDDIDNLSWFESLKAQGQRVALGATGMLESGLRARAIKERGLQEGIIRSAPDRIQEAQRQADRFDEILKRGISEDGKSPISDSERDLYEQRRDESLLAVRQWTDVQEFGPAFAGPRAQQFEAMAESLSQWARVKIGEPPEDNSLWADLAFGLGSMIAFVGPSLVPGGQLVTLQLGADAARTEAYDRAKAEGATEEDAQVAGNIAGFLGTSEALPIAAMLNRIPAGLRGGILGGISTVLGDMLKSSAEEGIQEFGMALAQNVIARLVHNPDQKILTDDAVRQGIVGAILGPLVSGPISTVREVREAIRQGSAAALTGETAAQLSKVDTAAAASKLRERAPDKFKEALDAQGLDTREVFVPADALKEYFQAKDLGEDTMREWGIDPLTFDEAVQSGNDVAVPLSNYATYISGTDAAAWFAENATSDTAEMSIAATKAFNASVQDIMQEAFDEAERARLADEDNRASDVQIQDQMFSQLRAAGRSPDVAQNEARIWAAFFRSMGERFGEDPLDLARSMGVSVRGPQSPEFRRRSDLDIALNTLRTQGQKALRPRGLSLAEFVKAKGGIQDTGGDVAAMGPPKGVVAGTAQDISPRRAQPSLGGTTPSTGRGLTLDEMGRVAAEAGYFPDLLGEVNAGTNAGEATDFAARLLEALGEDVVGRPVFAEGEGPDADMQALSDALSERGIDIATATNDEIAAALESTDGQEFNQDKRASIVFPASGIQNGETVINLFESADLSSFIHEGAHFFLEAFNALASDPAAPQQMRDDMATIREWLGNDGGPLTVEQHEQWARGGEAYFLEGKAPSLALADAFSRFKAWLTRIYKTALGLNVKITPEIREVMDRMLATDAEIAEARASQSMSPLFSEAPPGMSEADFATYQRIARRATDQAERTLLEKTMAKVRREKEAWFRDEKKAVRAEVAAETDRQPRYRLIDMLANQTWIGAKEGREIPDMQIDRKMLVDQFGEGVLAEVARTKIGGKRAIYGENGASPEEVAQFFGFASASEMIAVLQNTPKKQDAVTLETDRRMTERHGDPLNDGSIEEEALAAIHNDQQATTSVTEARHIAARLGRPVAGMTAKIYRQRARAMIGRMSVRDAIRSERFLAAERKAARAAQDAFAKTARSTGRSGQALAEALQAKEQQILNGFLYDEARKVSDYVQKGREKMRAYDKKSVRKRLEGGYIEQIDTILADYDFRVRGPRQIARSESLRAFIDRMVAEGREGDLNIDERMMDEAHRRHYTRLSVDELRGLFDTVDNIDHIGRFKQALIDAKEKRDLDAVAASVKSQIDANMSGKPPGRVDTAGEARHRVFRDFLNSVLNADTLLREMDGFKDLGPAWVAIKQKVNEGQSRLQVRRTEAVKAWDAIYAVYSGRERKSMTVRRHIPELNETLSKWDLISIALNVGNETNFERLTNPKTKGHFNRADLEAAFAAHLDERDWRTVQAIWDHVGSYWPEIEAKERRLTGVVPKRVEARPMIVGAPGFVSGGYFPIDYDGRLSGLATDHQLKDLSDSLMAGRFGKAQTKNGHINARVKSTGQTVRVDIGIGHRHVDQVLYDLELGEAVRNAWKILQHDDVRNALAAKGRQSDFDALEMWIKDVASGDSSVARGFEKVLRRIRSGFTISRLAWNIGTILLQPTGIAQSFVVVGKKAMMRGLTTYMSNPIRWRDDIVAVSPMMRERWKTLERDVHTQLGELQTGPLYGYEQFKNKVLMPSFYAGMMKVQFFSVDLPTWTGAYLKELDVSGDETRARTFADLMVSRAQGSGLQPDLGMLQRGSTWSGRKQELPKLFTVLGSYMFAKFNVAYEEVVRTNYRSPAEVLSLATNIMLLFTLEAVLYAALRGGLPDDDDDEGYAEWLAKETALSAMSTIPVLRELAGAAEGFSGGGAFGSSIEIAGRFLHQLGQAEADKSAVKSTVDLVGITLGLPSSQTNRVIDSLLDDDLSIRSDPEPLRALGIGGGKEKSLADMIFSDE